MSPTRILRVREVEQMTGLKKSAIYDRIRQNAFPRSIPLGDARNSPVGWSESEIAEWQAERLAAREARCSMPRADRAAAA